VKKWYPTLRRGRDECVEVLVEAGASLEAVDARGSTPLHAAAAGGHEDIVEYLLQKDADPTVGALYKLNAVAVAP
jgi:ankyrin repeat protein